MVTHLSFDEESHPEIIAGVRHCSGLFQFGAPDIVVVNVTKDAVWTRVRSQASNMKRPSRGRHWPVRFEPDESRGRSQSPTHGRRHAVVRDREIDPKKYYPLDVYRVPQRNFPNGFKIDVSQVVNRNSARRRSSSAEQEKSSNSSTS
jgi:hypothetical protein